MRSNNAKRIALAGMLAAVAAVIMCLGGFIPIATYVCPMLCCMTLFVVLLFCGKTLAWTWFAVVCILSLLMGSDKEAAIVFVAVGAYPILKHSFERYRASILLKFLYFNASIICGYMVMIRLLGMQEVATENMEFGMVGLIVILFLGNITFLLLDKLLSVMESRLR